MIIFSDLVFSPLMEERFEQEKERLLAFGKSCVPARVISLDRDFPLVLSEDYEGRAELSTTIKKSEDSIIAIGDWVALWQPPDHEKSVIECVVPRRNEIARVKRAGRERKPQRQVLAANVDIVFICQSLTGEGVDIRLLMRQMVAVAGCGAKPVFVLTKADLVEQHIIDRIKAQIAAIAPEIPLYIVSVRDEDSIDRLREVLPFDATALLLGESGVGKSSLVNALLGNEVAQVGAVRSSDDKGRHTTVGRRLLSVPGGGLIIDAPGLRTLQIIDRDKSLAAAFPDIVDAALGCRFRDCTHGDEPGCAVRGVIPEQRLASYRAIASSK